MPDPMHGWFSDRLESLQTVILVKHAEQSEE
jgi:hypothetical protein